MEEYLSEGRSHTGLSIRQLHKGCKVLMVTPYIIYVSWIITDIKDTLTARAGSVWRVT